MKWVEVNRVYGRYSRADRSGRRGRRETMFAACARRTSVQFRAQDPSSAFTARGAHAPHAIARIPAGPPRLSCSCVVPRRAM